MDGGRFGIVGGRDGERERKKDRGREGKMKGGSALFNVLAHMTPIFHNSPLPPNKCSKI